MDKVQYRLRTAVLKKLWKERAKLIPLFRKATSIENKIKIRKEIYKIEEKIIAFNR